MPAGNDAKAAAAELADRFGTGEARAEDLIAAQQAAMSQQLRAAQLLPRDRSASAELDWEKAAKACGVDADSVIDAAVRGSYVVVVYEDEAGRDHKAVGLASDAGVEAQEVSRGAKRAQRAAESADEQGGDDEGEAKKSAPKRRSRQKSASK